MVGLYLSADDVKQVSARMNACFEGKEEMFKFPRPDVVFSLHCVKALMQIYMAWDFFIKKGENKRKRFFSCNKDLGDKKKDPTWKVRCNVGYSFKLFHVLNFKSIKLLFYIGEPSFVDVRGEF